MSRLSADEIRIVDLLYTNFDKKTGRPLFDCTTCGIPHRSKQTLGCALIGYGGKGYKGKSCDGFLFSHPLKSDLQELWYLKDFIPNIMKHPASMKDLFFHRSMWEKQIELVRQRKRQE